MVEITSQKPKIVITAWHWPLWVSLVLFLVAGGIFMFLKIYLFKIQSDTSDINNQIKAESSKVNVDDENTMVRISNTVAVFKAAVANHSYFSDFFSLVNSLTHKRVVFTKIDADKEKSQFQVRGIAQNYTTLAKQMVALRENKSVKSLEVKGINFSSKGLEFELTVGADPAIFTKNQ